MPDTPYSPPLFLRSPDSKPGRWWASTVLGTVLGLAAIVASYLITTGLRGEVEGAGYALVGILQAVLVTIAVWLGLRPVGRTLGDIGLRGPDVLRDIGLGLSVAVAFAALQFGILIPATGGAARSDVVMNTSQIGGEWSGVIAFIVLALTGGFAEELLFRGHILTVLRNALGDSRGALLGAGAATVVLFAALHGYQGWSGVIDTGLYGGLTLTVLFVMTRGRLAACVAAHAGWNTLATLGLYLLY